MSQSSLGKLYPVLDTVSDLYSRVDSGKGSWDSGESRKEILGGIESGSIERAVTQMEGKAYFGWFLIRSVTTLENPNGIQDQNQ